MLMIQKLWIQIMIMTSLTLKIKIKNFLEEVNNIFVLAAGIEKLSK